MTSAEFYTFKGVNRTAEYMAKFALNALLLLSVLGVSAEPCISPGEPEGCIEIDTPLDTPIWILIAAVLGMVLYMLLKKNNLNRKKIHKISIAYKHSITI